MNPSLRRLSFRQLGVASEVLLRYLEADPELEPFLGKRPRDAADLLRRAPVNARRLVPSDQLSDALVACSERHDAPEPVLAAARAVADGDVNMVVTGQQPGLFGGPLYTIHKAATAVRLARELSALPDAPRVVPVFWNHTDDHDLDEVNRAFVVNGNLELQRIRLDLVRGGEPIRDVQVGRAMEHALAAVGDLLPHSEFRSWAFDLLQPRHPDESFGAQLTRLLHGLFGEHGLLVLEPRDLPAAAFEVLPRWCQQAHEIRATTKSSAEHLADLGLDSSLDPTATLMFHVSRGRRVPLADGELPTHPESASPGAVLRPLWQDACLPTIAFVVGPGELAYLAIAGPLYKQLGVPAPVLVPRASMTIVERSQNKLLERFGWDIPELARGPEELARSLEQSAEDAPEDGIEQLAGSVERELGEILVRVRDSDAQMTGPVERTRGKVADELRKLAAKMRRSRQNREGTGMRQIRKLCSNLRPRGRLQERVLTVLPYLVAHGVELGDALQLAADPFAADHIVVDL